MKHEFGSKIEKGDLDNAKMHDSVTVKMSALDKKSINYSEFCINHHAAKIAADLEIDKEDPNMVIFKFIPKVDKTKMSKKFIGNTKVVIETRDYFVNHYLTPTYAGADREPTMSVLKGDVVKCKNGEVGEIVKYSSNAEITIDKSKYIMGVDTANGEDESVTIAMICKDDIIEIINLETKEVVINREDINISKI